MAAQLTATNGPFRREDSACTVRATSSFPVPLSPAIRSVASVGAATSTWRMTSRIPPELPPVAADASQLHQIVVNLMTNAAHAIGESRGVVTLGLETVQVEDLGPAAVGDMPSGQYVMLSVHDTGCGMEPATVERIKLTRELQAIGFSLTDVVDALVVVDHTDRLEAERGVEVVQVRLGGDRDAGARPAARTHGEEIGRAHV